MLSAFFSEAYCVTGPIGRMEPAGTKSGICSNGASYNHFLSSGNEFAGIEIVPVGTSREINFAATRFVGIGRDMPSMPDRTGIDR